MDAETVRFDGFSSLGISAVGIEYSDQRSDITRRRRRRFKNVPLAKPEPAPRSLLLMTSITVYPAVRSW